MEIRVKKSTIICIIIIIVLIIGIGVLAYELISTKQNNEKEIGDLQNRVNTLSSNMQNTSKEENTVSNEKQELNEEELKDIENFLNNEENNGFIQGNYSKIEDISDLQWDWILISASQKIGDTSNTSMQEYSQLKNGEVFDTPVYKYKSEELINFIKEKTEKQYTVDKLQSVLPEDMVWSENEEYCYLSTGEAGYNQATDLSGYKQANNFIVSGKYYNPQYNENGEEISSFTVTMKNADTGYIFVSNEMK